jgi:hypothetical protein
MKNRLSALRLAFVFACVSAPASAQLTPSWNIGFSLSAAGLEYRPGAAEATQFIFQPPETVFAGQGTSSGPQSTIITFTSDSGMLSQAEASASVSNTTLRIHPKLEGLLSSAVISGPVCYSNPSVPGGQTCSNAPLVAGNWNTIFTTASATASISDTVSFSHATSRIGAYRMVFEVDGKDTTYLDTFHPSGVIGGTGGGYELGALSVVAAINFNNQTIWDHTTLITGSELPLNFNPTLPATTTPHSQIVYSPFVPVRNGVSSPIGMEFFGVLQASLTNLDSGRVLFMVEGDFSNTVHVAFEVYDTQGVLLPDAVVTGLDGASYTVMTTPVPEPGSFALWACGGVMIWGAVKRRRRLPEGPTPRR